MEFRELKYILTIEKYMNISHAAEVLYTSQPTLSKCLQKVEKEIGLPLFQRVGKKLVITYAGQVFSKYAQNILELEKSMNQELDEILQINRGVLNVGFPIMRANYMIPKILPAFYTYYPNIAIKLLEEHSCVLDEALLNGNVDIAFYNIDKRNSNLDYETISSEELVLVAAPDSDLREKSIIVPECNHPYICIRDITDKLFILTNTKQRTRQMINNFLIRENIELSNTIEITNILAGIKLAANGYGVTLTSESHLRHLNLPNNICIFSIAIPGIVTDFVAATRKNTYHSDYLTKFIDIVRENY